MLASSWFSFQIAMCPVKSVYDFSDPCITPMPLYKLLPRCLRRGAFPKCKRFSGTCPETISFYGVVTEMCVFTRARPPFSLRSTCGCLQKLSLCVCVLVCLGKARQDSSITPGRMEEVTPSHPLTHWHTLWETCILWFCPALLRPRQAKRHKSPPHDRIYRSWKAN